MAIGFGAGMRPQLKLQRAHPLLFRGFELADGGVEFVNGGGEFHNHVNGGLDGCGSDHVQRQLVIHGTGGRDRAAAMPAAAASRLGHQTWEPVQSLA